MPATGQNFPIWAGDSLDVDFPTVDKGGPNNGQPSDLSGGSLVWELRKAAGSPVILTKTPTLAGAIVTVSLAAADTAGLAAGIYDHALRYTAPGGKVSTLAVGKMTVQTA